MRVLITGAAGFVGSHAAHHLHAQGWDVIATDIAEHPDRLARQQDGPNWRYIAGDLSHVLKQAMPTVDQVWHFAANADIPLGATDTSVDLRESVSLTHQVLEAMRRNEIGTIVFPSSSAVYGAQVGPRVSETTGPLLPVSLYGAGKVAAEAIISAYGSTFGIHGVICRLGNVVGGAMGRGIVRDFLRKLAEDPLTLNVLGDGRQRKSYVLVDDVIAGMAHLAARPVGAAPVEVFNVAAGGSLDTPAVAFEVARAMGVARPRISTGAQSMSWTGDQPIVELDISRLTGTGWSPRASAAEAVFIAARRMLDEQSNLAR